MTKLKAKLLGILLGSAEKAKSNPFAKRAPPLLYCIVGLAIFLSAYAVAWVFYRIDAISLIIGICALPLLRVYESNRIKKIKDRVEEEFYELNQVLIAELETGVPMQMGLANIANMINADGFYNFEYMEEELYRWIRGLEMGERLDAILMNFGKISGEDSIVEYAKLISICTLRGGNLFEVISSTNEVLSEKRQMKRDVEVLIAEKKLEQAAMSAMPIFILLMLQVLAPEFISPLYESAVGRICMTVLLLIFALSFFWAKKLSSLK